jgi:dTDP-4-dehydrorhamnose 3,5-epimerase
MLWVPPGFAHGFLCLTDHTVFTYKCTQYYNKSAESGILWNDAALGIEWGLTDPIVSEKDAKLPSFNRFLVEHSSNSGS